MKETIKFISLSILSIMFIVVLAIDWKKEINYTNQEKSVNDIEINSNDSINYIKFIPSNVIDMVYYTDDNSFVIEYDDCDAFDYDNMNYYNHYIEIFADKEIFYYIIDCIYDSLHYNKNIFIKEEKVIDSTDYTHKFTLVYD